MQLSRPVFTASLAGLALLNLGLAYSLLSGRAPTPVAQAQAGGGGDYVMIAGEVNRLPADLVYVIDTINGGVIAVVYNPDLSRIESLPAINLNRVFGQGN